MTEDSNQLPHEAQNSAKHYEDPDGQPLPNTNTLKRNPKMELSKTELLRLLSYMEGELQAQSIVIAVLKSERVKHELNMGRYKPQLKTNPYMALSRDAIADMGTGRPVFETEMQVVAERQMAALDNLFVQQRLMQVRMGTILKDTEEKHQKVVHELEEEKRKHEHDTAQGDDITYGLEMERTRLKQELELEKQAKKRNEKDQKKFQECVEDERTQLKQIILYLLAEGKKTHLRYVEERKRSEDLAQILSEEKIRIDAMAEGLEEESKKSLLMEAELEKQNHIFEIRSNALKHEILSQEKKLKELKTELQMYKSMVNVNNVTETSSSKVEAPQPLVTLETTGMPSSVAKVMQPTSTVSSVPVSGPTTGIAQTIHSSLATRSPARQKATLFNSKTPASPSPVPAPTPAASSGPASTFQQYLKKSTILNRGVPPPIPPNKPIVPPKRDAVTGKNSTATVQPVTAAASSVTAGVTKAFATPLTTAKDAELK